MILPAKCAKDLVDVPVRVKQQLEIHLVHTVEQAIKLAFHSNHNLDLQLPAAL